MPSFPLIDQPWIPALDATGKHRLVSLRQAFADAHHLLQLAGDLPTQTMAILRLLLAILHRAVDGPADERAWRSLWQTSVLPVADIDSYLDEYRDRFDLLHPVTPFYQVADLRTQKDLIGGPVGIIADVPSRHPYLISRAGPALAAMTPADAARWLVHCQAYDVSGIKSGAVGDPRVKGGRGYGSGVGWCGALGGVFLEGGTLRETLLLNLIPLDSEYLTRDPSDSPVWERPPLGPAEEPAERKGPYGLLNLYTWQSRRIRLVGDETAITGALVAIGDKPDWDNRHRLEPMTAWRRHPTKEKQSKLPSVYVPVRHDPARALWRGLGTLLPVLPEDGGPGGPQRIPPALSQWLARTRNNGHLDAGYRVTTRAVGVVYGTQQSVVDEIYHDELTMTVRAFELGGGLTVAIVDSTADAERAVAALRRLADNLCRAAGGSGRGPGDPPATAAERAAELGYAALDLAFRRWLTALGPHTDPTQARIAWQTIARRAVLQLGRDMVAGAGPSAWAGRHVDKDRHVSSPQADVWFRRAVAAALPLAVPDGKSTMDSLIDTEATEVSA